MYIYSGRDTSLKSIISQAASNLVLKNYQKLSESSGKYQRGKDIVRVQLNFCVSWHGPDIQAQTTYIQ